MMDFTGHGATPAASASALAKSTRRAFHHAGALALCALALLVGIAVLDNYSIGVDALNGQRPLANAILRYAAGDSDAFETLSAYHDRFYGGVFEMPLLLAERSFDPNDSRSVFLVRHLLSHLFFLAAGFAGYLLAHRLFRSRAVALFALALFLLHPRIYAHSFFNSKDVPFLALFMICLWLAYRAFMGGGSRNGGRAEGSLGAFALCGVAAGLLVNLRVTGLAFVAVVAAARICDLGGGSRSERRRVLTDAGVFLALAALAYYASMPYLWADPFGRFAELLATLSSHPSNPPLVFQGEVVDATMLPPHYAPVWFAIATPPLALLLGAVGVASLARRGMARLHPHQHAYFNALATAIRADRTDSAPMHRRYWLDDSMMDKVGYAHIVEEHPDAVANLPAGGGSEDAADPDFYIRLLNILTARRHKLNAPEAFFPPVLYELRLHGSAVLRVATPDLSRVDAATAAAYRALYRETTSATPTIDGYFDMYRGESSIVLVRQACAPAELHERPRLTVHPARSSESALPSGAAFLSGAVGFRAYVQDLHGVRIGNACLWRAPLPERADARVRFGDLTISDAYLEGLRSRYAALAAAPPAARSTFDVHLRDGTLTYVKAPCVPTDVEAPFFLHVVPAQPSASASGHGFENLDFRWRETGVHVFENVCVVERALPDHPVASIATGQFTPGGNGLWRVELSAAR